MAVTVSRLEAVLTADTRNFDKSMDKSEGRMHSVGRAAGVAGLAIAGGLAIGLEKSVHAAIVAQGATARLDQAFKTAHLSANVYAKAIDAAESSGRKLGFTDEQIKESLGSLLIATHSVAKSTRDLSVAEDVARFKHVDLATATKTLTMAMAGSQRAVKQLGIDVPKVTTTYDALKATMGSSISPAEKLELAHAKLIDKQKTSALVIDTVRQKLGGQADAFSKTAAGGMEQFHAQLDHLEVKLGTGLLPVLTKLAEKLSTLVDWLGKHTTVAKIAAVALAGFALAMGALSVASTIAALSMSAFWIAATAGLVLVIPALIALIYELTKHWGQVTDAMKKVWSYIEGTFLTAWDDTLNAFKKLYGWLHDNWPEIATILSGPFAPIVALGTDAFGIRKTVVDVFDAIKKHIEKFADTVVNFVSDLKTKIVGWFQLAAIGDYVSGLVKDWVGFITGLPGRVTDFVADLKTKISGFFTSNDIGGYLSGLVKGWADFFTKLPSKIGDAIGGAMGDLKDKLQSLFSWHKIVGWIKEALGFGSPSPHFMAIGADIVDSMARGVGGAAGVLKDAVWKLAKEYAGGFVGKAAGAIGAIPGAKGTIIGEGLKSGIHASPDLAKQYAVSQLHNYGWGPSEMTPLYKLWNQESGWRWNALNGSMATGAYGIPQSHPPSKLANAGGDWRDNAFTQINWGLSYIKSKYGSPSRAWAQDVAGGLKGYALGGIVPGALGAPQLAVVHGGERITPPGRGGDIYNTFNFPHYVGDHRELEAAMSDVMIQYQRRNGRSLGGGF